MSSIDEIMERVARIACVGGGYRRKEIEALRKHLQDTLDAVELNAAGAMRERAAVTAWSAGMDPHRRRLGAAHDPREVGSLCAQAIRDLPVPAQKIEGGADYTLRIVADSGYEATTTGRCTAEQYGAAVAALHGVVTK